MSRIGQAPIAIPSGVHVTIEGRTVTVKGPKGELTRVVPATISVQKVDNELLVARPNDERDNRALHGLTRSLVNNMVVGVTDGFTRDLEIVGVGYRAAARVRPVMSSITWAVMCLFDRNTAKRGRSAVPRTSLRTRWWRRVRASCFFFVEKLTWLPFRPYAARLRRRSGRPCPCTARACGWNGCRRQPGRRLPCRCR